MLQPRESTPSRFNRLRLKEIDLSCCNISQASDLFKLGINLEKVKGLKGLIPPGMFRSCIRLETIGNEDGVIDLTDCDVKDAIELFDSSGIEKVKGIKGNIPKGMFRRCNRLKTIGNEDGVIDLTDCDVKDAIELFYASAIEKVKGLKGKPLPEAMFLRCTKLKTIGNKDGVIDLTDCDVKDAKYLFQDSGIEKVKGIKGNIPKRMFYACISLKTIGDVDDTIDLSGCNLIGAKDLFSTTNILSVIGVDQNLFKSFENDNNKIKDFLGLKRICKIEVKVDPNAILNQQIKEIIENVDKCCDDVGETKHWKGDQVKPEACKELTDHFRSPISQSISYDPYQIITSYQRDIDNIKTNKKNEETQFGCFGCENDLYNLEELFGLSISPTSRSEIEGTFRNIEKRKRIYTLADKVQKSLGGEEIIDLCSKIDKDSLNYEYCSTVKKNSGGRRNKKSKKKNFSKI